MDKNIVYHYCNLNTFYSIILNKTLRLSDITKSNDQLEITWANNIIRKAFSNSYNELKDEIKNRLKKEDYMIRVEEKIALYFEQNELRNKFFVVCFSGKNSGDLLSQWRGYGDDGQGIAIGINEFVLKKISDSVQMYEKEEEQCILYNKVIYDEKNQENKIKEIVIHFMEKLNSQSIDNGFGINNRLESILLECFPRLYQEAIFMKNPFFKEEDESRLVICEGKTGEKIENREFITSKKKYYIRNNQLVGYYDINLEKIKEQKILEIAMGPKCKLDKNTLLSFLQDNQFTVQEEIIHYSKGSYQ